MTDVRSAALADGLDRAALSVAFAARRRLHVPGLLEAGFAERVARTLEDDSLWRLVLNERAKHFDLHRLQLEAMDLPKRALLAEQVARNARSGFQYAFDNFPIADTIADGGALPEALAELHGFINGAPFLDFMRAVTGEPRIAFADSQATRFRPGHFLTDHDDDVEGKNRLFAYVLNFTRTWRPDWGGLLLFYGADGHIDEGYTPTFNAINLFRVPQAHAVSYVAPFAGAPRLSVTGWLRAA